MLICRNLYCIFTGSAPPQHSGGQCFPEQLYQQPPTVPGVWLGGTPPGHRHLGQHDCHQHGTQVTIYLLLKCSYMYHIFRCWFGYNHKSYYWISEGPRLVIIIVSRTTLLASQFLANYTFQGNFLFLVNIIRMLYAKVGNQSTTSETSFSQLR